LECGRKKKAAGPAAAAAVAAIAVVIASRRQSGRKGGGGHASPATGFYETIDHPNLSACAVILQRFEYVQE